MENGYLKQPLQIKWYLTNKCNLRCKFCYLDSFKGHELSITQTNNILNIIKSIDPIRVALLGGEPTEFEFFLNVITFLEKHEIPYSFSSNGQNLFQNTELVDFLSASKYLEDIQISLESSNSNINDNVRGKGTFSKAVKSIQELKKNRIKVTMAQLVTQDNLMITQNTVDFAASIGVDELRLLPFIPIGTGKQLKNRLFVNYQSMISVINNLDIPPNIIISSYVQTPENNKVSYGCGAGTTSVVINSDLTLSACDLLTQKEQSRDAIYDVDSFIDIWSSDNVFKSWRNGTYRESTSCNKCALYDFCGGYE
ncbi:radical SAM protein [Enterococcus faecium]|nr:radical SAM protein [Enterococcus faecium]